MIVSAQVRVGVCIDGLVIFDLEEDCNRRACCECNDAKYRYSNLLVGCVFFSDDGEPLNDLVQGSGF